MSMMKEMVIGLISAALLGGIIGVTIVAHAQDQSGFISIDCGLAENSTYTDATTGMEYVPDTGFIDTGVSMALPQDYIAAGPYNEKQLWTVRSFPEGLRNCYNLSIARGKGQKYLIRATFKYGNYDGRNQLPEFDLHLGVEVWDTVKVVHVLEVRSKEIIHIPSSNYIYVCLVNKKSGTPFISALELRPMNNSLYPTQFESLKNFARVDFGSTSNRILRYPDDIYDRLWIPAWNPVDYMQTLINTSSDIIIQGTNYFQLPQPVMRTAMEQSNASQSMDLNGMVDDPAAQYYVYMQFAELLQFSANQTREFNIYLNKEHLFGPFAPGYLSTSTVFSTIRESIWLNISLAKTTQSNLPPIINAIEIYKVKRFSQPQTYENDGMVLLAHTVSHYVSTANPS